MKKLLAISALAFSLAGCTVYPHCTNTTIFGECKHERCCTAADPVKCECTEKCGCYEKHIKVPKS